MQDIDRGGSRQWACVQFAFNSGGKTVGGQTMTSFWFAPENGNGSKEKGSEPTGEERATLALWYCTNLLIVVESKAAACDTKASQSYLVLFFIFPSM